MSGSQRKRCKYGRIFRTKQELLHGEKPPLKDYFCGRPVGFITHLWSFHIEMFPHTPLCTPHTPPRQSQWTNNPSPLLLTPCLTYTYKNGLTIEFIYRIKNWSMFVATVYWPHRDVILGGALGQLVRWCQGGRGGGQPTRRGALPMPIPWFPSTRLPPR